MQNLSRSFIAESYLLEDPSLSEEQADPSRANITRRPLFILDHKPLLKPTECFILLCKLMALCCCLADTHMWLLRLYLISRKLCCCNGETPFSTVSMEFINLFVIIVSFLCQMLTIMVNGSSEKPVRSKCFTDIQLVLFVVQLLYIILDGGSCRLRSCAVRNISSVFGSVRPAHTR